MVANLKLPPLGIPPRLREGGCQYDDCRGTYHVWYDRGEYEPVNTALFFGVSSALGVEPEELEALGNCVDPDALNDLFSHWRDDGRRTRDGAVSFTFAACDVRVEADGEIVIQPRFESRQ